MSAFCLRSDVAKGKCLSISKVGQWAGVVQSERCGVMLTQHLLKALLWVKACAMSSGKFLELTDLAYPITWIGLYFSIFLLSFVLVFFFLWESRNYS